MATIWSKAPDYILDVMRRLIDLYHEPLKEARIGVIMRSEAPRTGGRIILGKAEKVSPKAQLYAPYDFIIWLSKDQYQLLAPLQREALIDHELCHCQWEADAASLRPHDVEEFTEILERYGYWWPQAGEFAAVAQQAPLFEGGRGGVIAIDAGLADQFLRSATEGLPPDTRIEIGTPDGGGSDDDHRPTGTTIDDVFAEHDGDSDESEAQQ